MTTGNEETIRCACCGKRSKHWVLWSTTSIGSADLDQRPPGMERDTMDSWLQECPSCGYVAFSINKGGEEARTLVHGSEYRRLRSETFPSPEQRRFMLRAALANMKGDVESAFRNVLCAAWIADDRHQPEQATELRMKAAGYVAGRKGISLDTRLRLLDAYRRASGWDAAQQLVAELEAEKPGYPYDEIVDFHVGKLEAQDSDTYTIAEALPDPPRLSKPDPGILPFKIRPARNER